MGMGRLLTGWPGFPLTAAAADVAGRGQAAKAGESAVCEWVAERVDVGGAA